MVADMCTTLLTRTLLICLVFGSLGILSLNAQSVDEPVLKLGDPAPAFSATEFVQGAPFNSIGLGTVHVIEFSGTACKPCIQAIPTMEALQKKYDKAVFVSVFSGESPAEVRAFLGTAGKAMTGRVAVDEDQKMWGLWADAVDEDGIPLVFVVDKDQRIAWIGHPDELPAALAVIDAGKHDYRVGPVDPIEKTFRQIRRSATLRTAKRNERQREASRINNDVVTELIEAKKYQAAIDLLDGTIARFADLEVTEALRARKLFLLGQVAGKKEQAYEAARDFIVDATLDSTGRRMYLCDYVLNHYEHAKPENRDERMLMLVHAYFRTKGLNERPEYDSVKQHQIVGRAYHQGGQRDKAIHEIKL
ncbi:MAG: thiol-disulfide oxidoreductase, partial [Planctomycetaceae bacterium]|nr:thiol-disulfide oxidoreductase [Planctomycetaceae bacterium]